MNTSLSSTFCSLVRIDSVTGHEEKFADYLLENLNGLLSFVKKDKFGNVFGGLDGTGDPIFFASHMDTVEPGVGIIPKVRNEFVMSDGNTILGADNKVAIACMIEAAKRLQKKEHRPVEFIFTRSEEIGNYGALHFDYSLLKSKTGFCFDSVAPIGTIITASPHYMRLDASLIGKEAHASKPKKAINVLLILNEILSRITLGKVDAYTLVNIGIVDAGSGINTIPGHAVVSGEIRSLKKEKLFAAKKTIESIIQSSAKTYGAKVLLKFVHENPGYFHDSAKAKERIKMVASKMRDIGVLPRSHISWAVSDANIFNDKNILCLNLGDGVENPHSKHERVKISDMEKLVRLMIELAK